MKNVLITGVSGQDGIFWLLNSLRKINLIFGVTRSNHKYVFKNKLSAKKWSWKIKLINTNLENSQDVNKLILIPSQICFNLTGPSSVYDSFKDNNLSKILWLKSLTI